MKNKSRITIILTLLLVPGVFYSLLANGSHKHPDKQKKKSSEIKVIVEGNQKVCPIRKEKIDKDVYIDYQGQRIYFCCAGCDTKFLKGAEIYFEGMKERGEIADSTQKNCPVSGDALSDRDTSITLAGRKIYFCCKSCAKKFKKGKKAYLEKLGEKTTQKKGSHHHGSHKH
jgi:YHS domain-containing protein